MTNEERKNIIDRNPRYGKIICRCETVTVGNHSNVLVGKDKESVQI
mgnify:CR=1 FL=1